MTRLHGIDVSHWQDPALLNWTQIAQSSQFCIARATNGTRRDDRCAEHIRRARGAGLKVGLYHFFQHEQAASEQATAFLEVADLCELGPGDIIPFLDIEDDPPARVSPLWSVAASEVAITLSRSFGNCGVYTTQADWVQLGRPEWLPVRPIWCAHWGAPSPATPGSRAWSIWQYRVGKYLPGAPHDRNGPTLPGALDHNWATAPLPLIGESEDKDETSPLSYYPTLRRGMRSAAVHSLQHLLNRRGARPALLEDGSFGIRTEAAVLTFQRAHGLHPDGIVGKLTWSTLRRDTDPAPPPGGDAA